MRVSYWNFFEQLLPRLAPSGLPRQTIETIFTVELFVTGCLMIDPSMDVREGYTILSGYDSPVLPKHARREVAHRLRVLYSALRSRTAWENLFEQYEEVSVEYRLFEYNGERWLPRIPALFSDRRSWYENLLEQPIAHECREVQYATIGKFHYYKYNQEQEPIRYGGEVTTLPVRSPTFPRYRPKGNYKLQLGDENTYETEGMREASASSEWNERAGIGIKLKSLTDPNTRQFEYKGLQHIVGGLGSGKSTFMVLETSRLVQAGARVGFIESSVPQVLHRVKELRLLGINAVPVIGRSGRQRHQKDYLSARRYLIQDVTDWGNDNFLELRHLSDFCIIHALANDFEDTTDYPCRQLWQQGKKCVCPFAARCGIYQDFAALIDAEVWVTTSASILKTKLPVMLDPYERTFYEAMYDLLDIIFVDEADAVQKQFDDAFVLELALFGNSQHLFEKTLLESFRKTVGQYGKYAHDEVVQEWMDVLNRLESTIRRGIYRTLNLSPEYAQFLYRKLLRLSTEAYRISSAFAKDEQDRERIELELRAYADHPLVHQFYTDVTKMLHGRTKKEREQALTAILMKLGCETSPHGRLKYPVESLELYLCLALIDHDMQVFMDLYPLVQSKLGKLSEFEGLFSIQREFTSILKDAMTGRMTGYLYEVKPGSETGTFKAVQYSGVGRLLLEEWNSIYSGIDGYEGPAVVLLSGTSLAPGSAHYHIASLPGWLLESNLDTPIVYQEYYPVYDQGEDKPIQISGEIEDRRTRNLRTLSVKLMPKIEQELMEWRYSGSNRKVLLIVNSYEDVADVGAVFASYSSWKNRYRQLTRDPDLYREAEFSRAELERFANENADVLIAPLLAISRGYNILDETKGSLFGSVFFLIRPYPIPQDMTYLIQMLHAELPNLIERANFEGKTYRPALNFIRSESNSLLHRMYRKPDYWSVLNPAERRTIAWYTFVPVWQTIGRLLRKGTPARVFYCDGKFLAQPMRTDVGESMLDYWLKIMTDHEADPAFRSLYGPFIDSMKAMMERDAGDESNQ
jgi:hypothetical protein